VVLVQKAAGKQHNKEELFVLSLLVWVKETPPFRGSVCFVLREREEYTHI
jgi:hypothetical protein